MNHEVYSWIRYASILSTPIALLVLCVLWKRQPRQNRILAVSLFISLLFDLIGWSLVRGINPKSTIISNNIYFILALPAIMIFYHEVLGRRSLKLLVRIFTVIFLLATLISILDQGLNVPNTYSMTMSSILVTITSILFVADLKLMDPADFAKNPFHHTNIIVNTSLAIYYFATIIIFAASDYIYLHLTIGDSLYVWASHNATHVLKNAGLAIAFYSSAKSELPATRLQKVATTE